MRIRSKLITVSLLLAAIIHLLPLLGVLGPDQLEKMYGVDVTEPNLSILMRHRAILFGLLGCFLAYAAFRPALQTLAFVAALVSVVSFLVLAWFTGTYNPNIFSVVKVDFAALVILLIGLSTHVWPPKETVSHAKGLENVNGKGVTDPMEKLQPIAIHQEHNLERTGEYILFEDRIDVTIKKVFGETMEMSIPLGDLRGSTAIHHIRSSIFNGGLWVLIIGSVLFALPITPKPDLFFLVPILAIIFLIAGYKRIYLVSLLDHSGNPRLTLGVGKTKKEGLDDFLKKVLNAREADARTNAESND